MSRARFVHLPTALPLLVLMVATGGSAQQEGDDGMDGGPHEAWRMPLDSTAWRALADDVQPPLVPRRLRVIDGPGDAETGEAEAVWIVEARENAPVFEIVGRAPSPRQMHCRWL